MFSFQIDRRRRGTVLKPSRHRRITGVPCPFEYMQARMLLNGSPLPGVSPSPPTGLATVIAYNPDPTIEAEQLETISNPAVSGVAFQIDWSDIRARWPSV